MAFWKNSIVIRATPNRVFAYIDDPMDLPDWIPGMVEVRNVLGQGAGQQYEWTYKMVGLLLPGQAVVVEHVANRRTVHQNIGAIAAVVEFNVERHEEGAELTLEVEYGIPVPLLGKWAERIVKRRNDRELDLALANIKDVLETQRGSVEGVSDPVGETSQPSQSDCFPNVPK